MNRNPHRAVSPWRQRKFVTWMVLAAIVFAGFVWLGTWQVRRYHLKVRISHAMTSRVHAPPQPAPGPADWPKAGTGDLPYRHVRLHGRFVPGKQTLVRGSSRKGYGLWVMQPLRTDRGFIVLVNRGYIPADLRHQPEFAQVAPPRGEVDLTGLVRTSEPGGGFLRANKPAEDEWYSRDVAAIARAEHLPAAEVAPYFVDEDAGVNPHHWPVGGLTKVSIYNHSMGYAITWYALALGTLVCAGIVMAHERARSRNAD